MGTIGGADSADGREPGTASAGVDSPWGRDAQRQGRGALIGSSSHRDVSLTSASNVRRSVGDVLPARMTEASDAQAKPRPWSAPRSATMSGSHSDSRKGAEMTEQSPQTPRPPQSPRSGAHLSDGDHLSVLGYSDSFERSMSVWANFALGFTYLSPLVGVYCALAVALAAGGPPSIWWIVIVAAGQMLVALVFGEVVSQFPIAGGIYPWARRLWGKRYAWMAAWVYICAMIVTITSVAEFGAGFVASLFDFELTRNVTLVLALALLVLALAINFSGTKWLARIARIGLFAELIGVIGLGLFLLIFERKHPFSVFFDAMGVAGDGSYLAAFMGRAVAGLFLFYGFEACGDVAEEVSNPARGIPKAMIMTIVVGAVSALFSFGGYVLAAPNLDEIVAGEVVDPIPSILEGASDRSVRSSSSSSRSSRSSRACSASRPPPRA